MEAEKAKILIVDDNERIRKTLRRLLSKEAYEIHVAENGETAIRKMSEQLPDMILLDVMMPGMDGMEVCRRIKENHKYSFVYIIMLTAKTATDDEVAGLDLGADDYVGKPFDPPALLARVRRGLRLAEEKRFASFDPLTRLYNRRMFDIILRQETEKFRRYRRPLSLILIDLDRFKSVNDTFGHKAGDRVLQEVAGILRDKTRKADLPARWGGEELAILLPETGRNGAKTVAENLRKRIEIHEFPQVGKVTASLGVASMTRGTDDLVRDADAALYQAKTSGRNKVVSAL